MPLLEDIKEKENSMISLKQNFVFNFNSKLVSF